MKGRFTTSLGATIGCVIATLLSSPVQAERRPASFDFAAARFGDLEATATTEIKWSERAFAESPPIVAQIQCRGVGSQFAFGMNNIGALSYMRITFLGSADQEGERGEITLLGDHLWLYVDDERWEFANIPARSPEFSNLRYPPPSDSIMVVPWRGYQAVRKTEADPWTPLSRFYEHLIKAKRIEWSFKSRNWKDVDSRIVENRLPEGWDATRYSIDNDKLRDAISWCARQVLSDAAYVLPDQLRKDGLP